MNQIGKPIGAALTEVDRAHAKPSVWREFLLKSIVVPSIVSVVTCTVAGLISARYQLFAAIPVVKYSVVQRQDGWEISVVNQSRFPANAVVIDAEFDDPIASHAQPRGLLYWSGRPLESTGTLAGRSHVVLRCDVLPPGSRYPLFFRLAGNSHGRPKVMITSNGGFANEE